MPYAVGLMVLLAVLSVATVPLAAYLVGVVYGRSVEVAPAGIALVIATSVLAPLAGGIAIGAVSPRVAERMARPAAMLAMVLMPVAAIAVLTIAAPALWPLTGDGSLLAIVAFLMVGFVVGHALGGSEPTEETRGARSHLAVEDQVLYGDVVPAEAPGPGAMQVGFAEHAQPVQLWVPSTLAAPVDLPVLDMVEHVLQAHDGGCGDVAGFGQAGGDQLHGAALLPRAHARSPADAAGRVRRSVSAARDSVASMRYGFIFPGTDPELAVELAVLAEQHGWHGFFVWEGIWATDPWATLAAAAVRTSRIRLGTMLTPVPRRRPWELAGQTMTVDRLSGGRLVLSAGLGVAEDAEDRFWIFEHDPGRRVRAELLDESLELLPRLWRGEPFEHEGRHYTVRRTEQMLPPTPVQQPGIPIWAVGLWPRPRSMRRVARLDGWLPNYAPPGEGAAGPDAQRRLFTPEIGAEAMAWLRAERERLGLADRPFDWVQEGTTAGLDAEADAAVVRPWAEAGATWWLDTDWSVPAERVEQYARDRLVAGPPAI